MKLDLNDEVKKQIPQVEEVFLFDNDDCSLLLHSMIKHPRGTDLSRCKSVGLKSLTSTTCAHVSIYTMPNGKKCAIAYPSSLRVHYGHFKKGISDIFKHVDRSNWHSSAYPFYLFCIANGFVSNLKDPNS